MVVADVVLLASVSQVWVMALSVGRRCCSSIRSVAAWFFSGVAMDFMFILRSSLLGLWSFDALCIGWIGFLAVVVVFFVVMQLAEDREKLGKGFEVE